MAVYLSNASFQVDSRPPGVKNWHAGEKAVQTALNYRYALATLSSEDYLEAHHQLQSCGLIQVWHL